MNKKIINLIANYHLNLSGLTVLTEAASGAYLLNPFIALAAGAEKVICKTRTTRYGKAEDIIEETLALAKQWGCFDRIEVKEELSSFELSQADIITNSGHLRPISKKEIMQFKSTAVIPLMWETWEFRESDLDLKTCKRREILVLGTNESMPPCDMRKYSGMIGVKLAIELGLEIAGNKILLIGSTNTLCTAIKESLLFLGANIVWCGNNNTESDFDYSQLEAYLLDHINEFDAILIAEHHYNKVIFGKNGFMTFEKISEMNKEIKIGISCGNIDVEDLNKSKLSYFPHTIEPFGYMSYQSYHVGPLPVMDLFAAGLKVGEVMARSRLSGMSVKDATLYTLQNSPAMDFERELSWL